MSGRLVLCGTPIGNLGDASPRLRAALESADVIFAEDTRRSRVLFAELGVDKQVRSYFVGNERSRVAELGRQLAAGRTVALVTDAGMPAISDPGVSAVREARRVGAAVVVVPGPSAVTAALSASGLPGDRFVFEGFLPRKGAARSHRLLELAREERTIVLFSTARRVAEDLSNLADTLGRDRQLAVCRELTKRYEEVWWGTLGEALDRLEEVAPRGEFTIVLHGAQPSEPALGPAVREVAARMERGEAMAAAVREVADEMGVRRRRLYQAVLSAVRSPGGGRDLR